MPTPNPDYNPPVPAFSVRAAQVRAGKGTVAVQLSAEYLDTADYRLAY